MRRLLARKGCNPEQALREVGNFSNFELALAPPPSRGQGECLLASGGAYVLSSTRRRYLQHPPPPILSGAGARPADNTLELPSPPQTSPLASSLASPMSLARGEALTAAARTLRNALDELYQFCCTNNRNKVSVAPSCSNFAVVLMSHRTPPPPLPPSFHKGQPRYLPR